MLGGGGYVALGQSLAGAGHLGRGPFQGQAKRLAGQLLGQVTRLARER